MRVARQKLGWTQRRLAVRAQLHKTIVCAIERGRLRPSQSQARRIARALGYTVEQLFAEEKSATATPALTPDKTARRQTDSPREKVWVTTGPMSTTTARRERSQ
jgi:ribosome-binding protein aMBF1 (putative translation factor)